MEDTLEQGRAQTDAKLDAERSGTDAASERSRLRARSIHDDLIERDRMAADQQLSKYRESVDSVLARERLAPFLRSRLDERNQADVDKRAERGATDALVEHERREADAGVASDRRILDQELGRVAARQQATNEQLSMERLGADAAVLALAQSNDALDHAREDVRRRTDILSMVTHDLRSPLCVIAVNTQLLADQAGDAATHEILEDILLAAARMERLLSDLLDVARVASDTLAMDRRDHDVATLVAEVVRTYRPLFVERGISFHGEGPGRPCVVSFDHDRIVQVLSNLLGNAMKFAPAGGAVTLSVAVQAQQLEFAVSDNGAGISKDAIPHVFERFWGLAGKEQRGLGLGLYISKKLIAAHGGKIWVESQPGQGATFRFTLPRIEVARGGEPFTAVATP